MKPVHLLPFLVPSALAPESITPKNDPAAVPAARKKPRPLGAELRGRLACETAEGALEVRERVGAGLIRGLADPLLRIEQQRFRPLHAPAREELGEAEAGGFLELLVEIEAADVHGAGHLVQSQRLRLMLPDEFPRAGDYRRLGLLLAQQELVRRRRGSGSARANRAARPIQWPPPPRRSDRNGWLGPLRARPFAHSQARSPKRNGPTAADVPPKGCVAIRRASSCWVGVGWMARNSVWACGGPSNIACSIWVMNGVFISYPNRLRVPRTHLPEIG